MENWRKVEISAEQLSLLRKISTKPNSFLWQKLSEEEKIVAKKLMKKGLAIGINGHPTPQYLRISDLGWKILGRFKIS